MLGFYSTVLRWFVTHPWTMAWVAFFKGAVVGALAMAAVQRRRERSEREAPTNRAPDRPLASSA